MISYPQKPKTPRNYQRYVQKTIAQIHGFDTRFRVFAEDQQFLNEANDLRACLQSGKLAEEYLPQAYALVKEVARRKLFQVPRDNQLAAAIALHYGYIADMPNGEGKTLAATMPLFLNALYGFGVHLITSNFFLAQRDALWMAPIYHTLGVTVGAALAMDQRRYFRVVPKAEGGYQLEHCTSSEAYECDILYTTLDVVVYDYLGDHGMYKLSEMRQRDLFYAIVDEVDINLIDRAREPWTIGDWESERHVNFYNHIYYSSKALVEDVDYQINREDRKVSFTSQGLEHISQIFQVSNIFAEQYPGVLKQVENAILADKVYQDGVDYLIENGNIRIIDQITHFTRTNIFGRGLHQALEVKEGLAILPRLDDKATITTRFFFNLYHRLAGMSGTAGYDAEELEKVYRLKVIQIPGYVEYLYQQNKEKYQIVKKKMGFGECNAIINKNKPDHPIGYRRLDLPDVVYRDEEAMLRGVILDVLTRYLRGQPVLVGTTSVVASLQVHARLNAEMLTKFARVLILKEAWIRENNVQITERLNPELAPLFEPLEDLDVDAIADELDIDLEQMDPNAPENLQFLARYFDNPNVIEEINFALQNGIPHTVLNAENVDDIAYASTVIQDAGRVGAVTIITNVAGVGVDIQLGGKLPREEFELLLRILHYANIDPTNKTIDELFTYLEQVPEAQRAAYQEKLTRLRSYWEERQHVIQVGGLHVIGMGRGTNSRRLESQLRGRAARQGNPGSSVFLIALDGELMLEAGGKFTIRVMEGLRLSPDLPLESGIVTNLIAGVQNNIEIQARAARNKLISYDAIVDEKRRKVYSTRESFFQVEDFSTLIHQTFQLFAQNRIAQIKRHIQHGSEEISQLEQLLRGSFPAVFPADFQLRSPTKEDAVQFLQQQFTNRYQLQTSIVERIGHRTDIERLLLLNSLDNTWKQFLRYTQIYLRENLAILAYNESDRLAWFAQETDQQFEKFKYSFLVEFIQSLMSLPAQTPKALQPSLELHLSGINYDIESKGWEFLSRILAFLDLPKEAEEAAEVAKKFKQEVGEIQSGQDLRSRI